MIPDQYKHAVDLQADTIGTLETYMLIALARIKPTDTDTIARLSTSGVWREAAQFSALVSPDLHPYLFRLTWTWPSGGKTRYQPVVGDDDQTVVSAIARLRQTIVNRATADLSSVLNDGGSQLADMDRLVSAIQDAMLLAVLARLQYSYQVAVNMVASTVAEDVDILSRWRKRFQLLSGELLAYLQRSRFADRTKTFVPLRTKSNVSYANPMIWTSTGELDYARWV